MPTNMDYQNPQPILQLMPGIDDQPPNYPKIALYFWHHDFPSTDVQREGTECSQHTVYIDIPGQVEAYQEATGCIVYFRLEINNLMKIWAVSIMVSKRKGGSKVNPCIIKYMAAAYRVEQPLSGNLDKAKFCYR